MSGTPSSPATTPPGPWMRLAISRTVPLGSEKLRSTPRQNVAREGVRLASVVMPVVPSMSMDVASSLVHGPLLLPSCSVLETDVGFSSRMDRSNACKGISKQPHPRAATKRHPLVSENSCFWLPTVVDADAMMAFSDSSTSSSVQAP